VKDPSSGETAAPPAEPVIFADATGVPIRISPAWAILPDAKS